MNKYSRSIVTPSSEFITEDVTKRRQCLNCGEFLFGLYCQKCGQKDISFSKPLPSVLSIFFDSWFSFDNRTVRSVFLLFSRPGFLSAQFVAGKRMSFASPIKLYLFSSICYFFFFNISMRIDDKADISITFNNRAMKESLAGQLNTSNKADDQRNTSPPFSPSNSEEIISTQKASTTATKIPSSKIADRISEKLKNPDSLWNSLLKGFSYMILVLMPLFALLLMWSMARRKLYYFDHLVHAIHFHAFALLFFSLLLIAEMVQGVTIMKYLIGIVALYLVVSIRTFYDETWVKSIVKSILILSVYGFISAIILVSTTLIIIAL